MQSPWVQAENLEAVVDFYAKYPEYLNRPLYITGERSPCLFCN